MVEVNAIVIPTRTGRKISHQLSFPIGAERTSIPLASVRQLPQLVVHFGSDYFNRVRSGHYPFLWIRYVGRNQLIDPVSSSGIPLFNQWEIAVGPVPSVLRHRIHLEILGTALLRIRRGLDQRVDLEHSGSESLTLFFDEKDEKKEEVVLEQDSRLEPARGIRAAGPKRAAGMGPTAAPKKESSRL
jgi:hypothetical protein